MDTLIAAGVVPGRAEASPATVEFSGFDALHRTGMTEAIIPQMA